MISNQFLGMGVDFASTFESANGSISHATNNCPNSELLPKIASSWHLPLKIESSSLWVIVALVIPLEIFHISGRWDSLHFNITRPFFGRIGNLWTWLIPCDLGYCISLSPIHLWKKHMSAKLGWKRGPYRKESSLPTTSFQETCWFSGL